MAKYVFSKKKFIKEYGKKEFLTNRDWIKKAQGVVFEAEPNFKFVWVGTVQVSSIWCTRLDKTNYKKNF